MSTIRKGYNVMNDDERYLFDVRGYHVIRDALSPKLLGRLDAWFDEAISERVPSSATTFRFPELVPTDPVFRDLIDNQALRDTLEEILGSGFRLDHTYADLIREGDGPIGHGLHGGGTPFRADSYYVNTGEGIRSGLVAVAYNVRDVEPGVGGFGCIPGSHKAAFALPEEWRRSPDPHPCVTQVPGKAGSAIVFTEALAHCTLPWRGSSERRTVFYKYSPGCVSWSAEYYDQDEDESLTDAQRDLLSPPNGRYRLVASGRR